MDEENEKTIKIIGKEPKNQVKIKRFIGYNEALNIPKCKMYLIGDEFSRIGVLCLNKKQLIQLREAIDLLLKWED